MKELSSDALRALACIQTHSRLTPEDIPEYLHLPYDTAIKALTELAERRLVGRIVSGHKLFTLGPPAQNLHTAPTSWSE